MSTQEIVIFEAGTTSEKKAEINVVPDAILEPNETYILLLFIRSATLNQLNLVLMNNSALVTILNDDSKLYLIWSPCVKYILMFTANLPCLYYIIVGVTVNLASQVESVVEGNDYVASIRVEPTDLMTSFNVIVETYSCGGCIGANRK